MDDGAFLEEKNAYNHLFYKYYKYSQTCLKAHLCIKNHCL